MARQPLPPLLAISALLAAPLAGSPGLAPQVLAQATPDAIPAAAPAPLPVAPPPPLDPQPPAAPAVREVRMAPAATGEPAPAAGDTVRTPPPALRGQPSAPLQPPAQAATESTPALRPGLADRQISAPRRFEQSLDDLIREGVVSPREVRVRVHPGLISNPALLRQGCNSGAFSASECGGSIEGGVVFRGRGGSIGEAGGVAGSGDTAGYSSGGGSERYGIDAAPLPPIAVPVTALLSGIGGNFRLTDVFRITPRPQAVAGNGNRSMIFPLIGAAETSSGFGWRLHPILGTWLMHSGRDLAAPEGTPVVAALSGRVVSSGDAGGYGLAIELDHDNPRRRTLYGHLSELYVKEGDRVRQGEVIGRVGSTGRSTGPHLHFEVRMPQEGGWVAVEPGELAPGGGPLVAGLAGGLAGLNGANGAPPTDAIALLMGQLLQSLERPRSPLGNPGDLPGTSPTPGSPGPGTAAPARPLPTDRLPKPFPPAASVPPPAPLPRNPGNGATPGG